MGRITLFLSKETETKMKSAAKAAGVSPSQWVAALIEKTRSEWPASVARLAGACADFPTAEEVRQGVPEDLPREPLA